MAESIPIENLNLVLSHFFVMVREGDAFIEPHKSGAQRLGPNEARYLRDYLDCYLNGAELVATEGTKP